MHQVQICYQPQARPITEWLLRQHQRCGLGCVGEGLGCEESWVHVGDGWAARSPGFNSNGNLPLFKCRFQMRLASLNKKVLGLISIFVIRFSNIFFRNSYSRISLLNVEIEQRKSIHSKDFLQMSDFVVIPIHSNCDLFGE